MNRHKIRLFLVLLTFATVILAACGSQPALTPFESKDISLPVIDTDAATSINTLNRLQNIAAQTVEQRIVLKDATLQLVVENVTASLDAITKLAEDMGGWVISSNTTKSAYNSANDSIVGSIAIRVPAAQFNNAITQIKNQSTSVDAETTTGKDVTQEYIDLNSQVTNLQAAEKQLQTILDSARTTDDVLQIYNELVRVRGEIETTQGRINYYKEAASFSSISVSLRPPTVAKESVQVDTGWNPLTTVKGAFNALVNIVQGLINLLIIIVVLVVPLLLLVGIPIWIIYHLNRRYGWIRNTKQTILPEAPEPPST